MNLLTISTPRLRRRFSSVLFAWLLCVTIQGQSLWAPSLDQLAFQTMRNHGVPGLAVGVVKSGRVYAKGFGNTALHDWERVTIRSRFFLASITKTFTAVAIMQLVEKRKIGIDNQVTHYLPYFKLADQRYGQITIRHLLTHTSGLEFIEENPFERKAANSNEALELHIRALASLRLSAAPGSKFEYSNEGYDILGDVIAKVSGITYEEYVHRNIFVPLRMLNSTVLINSKIPTRYYSDEKGSIVVNDKVPYSRAFAPSSTLESNVEDMSHWIIACLNKGFFRGRRILKSSSFDEMWKLPIEQDRQGEFPIGGRMGGGWFRWNYRGHQIVGHGGAELGFNSFLAIAPDDRIGVIILGNLYPAKVNYSPTGTYYASDLAKAVLDTIAFK